MLKIALLLFAVTAVFTLDVFNSHLDMKNYFRIERVHLLDWSRKYFEHFNATARRYSRKDPLYYFNCQMITKYTFGNNITVDLVLYEWLSNQYKRSFVELHVKLCNIVDHVVLGVLVKPALIIAVGEEKSKCPFPPGNYNLQNMTLPAVKHMPFTKGRVYVNVTFNSNEIIAHGHGDFEIVKVKTKFN